ncbi:hypothetical protein LEM8419_03189 [Neolewinella maritima]|uniref:Sigma-70 family RNA polymerase sigma factor n=1 Tax=Neolewinella maritima TaxID=1383882 RepID=A0ABN8F5T1_9BACT|nr:sigma-70 family RNA polymerase sigma factor [Neolewinella maritima]CAH1002270.1 hypothetical protein LEM8419_03189 [Neolewinella maritima]
MKTHSFDQTLLEAIRANDPAALDTVYRTYRTPCLRFLLGRVIRRNHPNRETVAVELFTESLIVLVNNIRSGRLRELTARIDTYLNAVGRNLYLKLERRGREIYRDPSELPEPLVSPEREVRPEEVRQELYRWLGKLGPSCRQLIVHFYFLELDWNTIADLLGYKNAASAKTNKSKCMSRLRKLYAETVPK